MTNPTASTTPHRDEVRRQIIMNLNEWGSDDPEGEADAMIDAYVHELAETIRAQHSAVYQDAGQKVASGMLRAADLIDSQVSAEPVEHQDEQRIMQPSGPWAPGKEAPLCLNCGKRSWPDRTAPDGLRHMFGTIKCDPQVTP